MMVGGGNGRKAVTPMNTISSTFSTAVQQ